MGKSNISKYSKYKQIYEKELFESCLPFWLNNSIDKINGGIFTCLDRKGKVYSTDKSVWMLGRGGWTFSNLCDVYGPREEWLSIAKECISFAEKHCIDPATGRMAFQVTAKGGMLRRRRYYFSECFFTAACAENYGVTKDQHMLDMAREYYDFAIEMYGNSAIALGDIPPKVDPLVRSSKGLSAPMILLNVTNTMRKNDPQNAEKYTKTASRLCNDIISIFYNKEENILLEHAGSNGEYRSDISSGRVINPGHCMEAVWFLLVEAIYQNDEKLKAFAENIFESALSRGWDNQYGGLLYMVDAKKNPPELSEHDMKLWWVHNEAIIAALMLYRETGKESYFNWFEKFTDYSFSSFSDPEYGEWYGYLRRDGAPTEPILKGNTFKGPFHLPRMLIIVDEILGQMIDESKQVGDKLKIWDTNLR